MSSLSTKNGFCEDESGGEEEEVRSGSVILTENLNFCKFEFEFSVEEVEVLLMEFISKLSSLVKSIKEIFEDDEEKEDDGVMCFKFSPG